MKGPGQSYLSGTSKLYMSISRKLYRFFPGPGDVGARLDQYVSSQTEELSRTFLRKIVELGGVHVGGRRVRQCSHSIKAGKMVEIHLDGLPLEPYTLKQQDIVYQDKYLLVVAKPAGVETQPTPAHYKGTLYEALRRYLRDPFRPMDRPEVGMVQRLDRETSGIMVFSVHPRAHRGLTWAFAGRKVRKIYLALIYGNLPEGKGEIRSLLARAHASNRVRSVAKGGKEAITYYRVTEEFADASVVEVEILTGRSHQIRAHFAEIGHPLLGDVRYGGPRFRQGREIPRQMLHSWRLELPHPVWGETLVLQAPLPTDMEQLLHELRE